MTTQARELAGLIDNSGNVTAGGNLTVSGTTTTVSSTVETHADPLIELNTGAGSNANDLGFVFERGSTGDNACIIWDESNDAFAVGTTTATGTSTGNMSYTVGDLLAGKVTVDNVIINGTTIGHTDDTDLITLADGALTVAGTLAPSGVLTANAGVVVDNITIDGTEIDLSSGDLTLDVAGDIILDADGADVKFSDGGTHIGTFTNSSSDFVITSAVQDKDIVFKGDDNGSAITALTLDMSDAGAATFNNKIVATELDISGNVDIDGILETDNLTVGGAQGSDGQVLTSTGSGVAWEDASGGSITGVANGADNRIATFSSSTALNGEANLTFDGSTLAASGAPFTISNTNNGNNIDIKTTSSNSLVHAVKIHSGGVFEAKQGAVFNEDSNDVDFRVESNGNANRFFIDAGSNSGEGAVIVGHNASLGQHRVFQISGNSPDTSGMEMFKYTNDTSGPTISMSKSRGGAIGTAAAINDNDVVGTINWFADDGTDTGNYVATIHAEIDGTPGTDDTPGALVLKTTADGANSPTERMRISSAGNVGIGTAAPDSISQLELSQSGSNSNYGTHLKVTNGGSHPAGIRLHSGHGNWTMYNSKTVADALEFADDSADVVRVVFKNDGKVGINESSPDAMITAKSQTAGVWAGKLENTAAGGAGLLINCAGSTGSENLIDVRNGDYTAFKIRGDNGLTRFNCDHNGDGPPGDWMFTNDDSNDGGTANVSFLVQSGSSTVQILPWVAYGVRLGTRTAGWDSTGSQNLYLTTNDTARITVVHSTGVASGDFNDTCDERLKKDIVSIGNTTSKLKQLRPVTFKWKENDREAEGFIAQEIEAVFPELIETQTGMDADDLVGTGDEGKIADVKSVNTNGLLARAIKTIQELEARITVLEG